MTSKLDESVCIQNTSNTYSEVYICNCLKVIVISIGVENSKNGSNILIINIENQRKANHETYDVICDYIYNVVKKGQCFVESI